MSGKRFKLITVESDFGAGRSGAALGPQAVLHELRETNFPGVDLEDYIRLAPDTAPATSESPFSKNIENIRNFQEKIVVNVQDILRTNRVPFVLSGDHSSANAVISGIKDYHANARIGVIWVDAHADLHSPYTTPSGNVHGMPIAALMGDDHREMARNQPQEITKTLWEVLKKLGRKRISPKIESRDLVFIALRSTEMEEERIISKEGIKTFRPADIKTLGIAQVAAKTLEHLRNCQYLYVSFDVDSLDPSLSVGTGTPVENGLSLDEATHLLKTFTAEKKLVGFEVTEVNPILDIKSPMEKVVCELLQRVFLHPL
jgi:arginase